MKPLIAHVLFLIAFVFFRAAMRVCGRNWKGGKVPPVKRIAMIMAKPNPSLN